MNNMDLIWDVGNFHFIGYNNSTIYPTNYSSAVVAYTTSIQDKIVKNVTLSASSQTLYNDPANNNFTPATDSYAVNGTLPSTAKCTILRVTNGSDSLTSGNSSTIMNKGGNLTYAGDPLITSYYSQNGPNYTDTNASLASNVSYAFGTGSSNYCSIHLNHYLYAWTDTYSNMYVGQADSSGNLRKPTFTGIQGIGPSVNAQGVVGSTPTKVIPTSYGTFSGYYWDWGSPPYQFSKSIQNLSSTGSTDPNAWLAVFNTANSFTGNQTALLHAHWKPDVNAVPNSLRVNGHKWDKPHTMFPNRSKYRYYSGTTSTAFTTISGNDTSLLTTEKAADDGVTDARFRWSLPFYTGSYLVSPANKCPLGTTYTSYDSGSTQYNTVPNYCFWIQDSSTYTALTTAGVRVSPDSNFNMNIKFQGDTSCYNNIPKRCLGALYNNSTGTNLSTSSINTLCPSSIQYKALGWNLCTLPSSLGGCTLTYLPSNASGPNAIINKYGTVAFRLMDAYTALSYYNGDPANPKNIVTVPSTLISSNVFTALGGCKNCNCMSSSLVKEEEPCTTGYCVHKATLNYYEQMKQINGQQNTQVFQFSKQTESSKWVNSELQKEFFTSEAYLQSQRKKKDTNKENFDVCHIAAGLIAGGANFILGITYNPIASLVSQLKPFRAMHPINVATPDWSCSIPGLDEIIAVVAVLGKALWSGISSAFATVAKVASECVSAICNLGKSIYNSVVNFFTNAFSTVISGLISFSNGICSAFRSLGNSISSIGNTIWSAVQQAGSAALNFITSVGVSAWNAISSAGSIAISYVSSAFSTFFTFIGTQLSNIANAIGSLITLGINALVNSIISAGGYIGNQIISIFSW